MRKDRVYERVLTKPLWSVKQVAEYFQVHPNYVYDLAKRYETSGGTEGLRMMKIGGQRRARLEDIESYLISL